MSFLTLYIDIVVGFLFRKDACMEKRKSMRVLIFLLLT